MLKYKNNFSLKNMEFYLKFQFFFFFSEIQIGTYEYKKNYFSCLDFLNESSSLLVFH